MKKNRIVIWGMIGIILFGVLLPQPLQALLVLSNLPIRRFFSVHTVALCIIVGLIQGICEECGYYLLYRTVLKKYQFPEVPILFGIGRSGLELLYNVVIILTTGESLAGITFLLIARGFGLGGAVGLSILDYVALQPKKRYFLFASIMFHATMNGILYAMELNMIPNGNSLDSWFMILFAFVIMIIAYLVYRMDKNS